MQPQRFTNNYQSPGLQSPQSTTYPYVSKPQSNLYLSQNNGSFLAEQQSPMRTMLYQTVGVSPLQNTQPIKQYQYQNLSPVPIQFQSVQTFTPVQISNVPEPQVEFVKQTSQPQQVQIIEKEVPVIQYVEKLVEKEVPVIQKIYEVDDSEIRRLQMQIEVKDSIIDRLQSDLNTKNATQSETITVHVPTPDPVVVRRNEELIREVKRLRDILSDIGRYCGVDGQDTTKLIQTIIKITQPDQEALKKLNELKREVSLYKSILIDVGRQIDVDGLDGAQLIGAIIRLKEPDPSLLRKIEDFKRESSNYKSILIDIGRQVGVDGLDGQLLVQKIKTLVGMNNDLSIRIQSLESQNDRLSVTIKQFGQQIAELRTTNQQLEDEIETLNQQIRLLSTDISDLRTKIQEYELIIEQNRQIIIQYEHEIEYFEELKMRYAEMAKRQSDKVQILGILSLAFAEVDTLRQRVQDQEEQNTLQTNKGMTQSSVLTGGFKQSFQMTNSVFAPKKKEDFQVEEN